MSEGMRVCGVSRRMSRRIRWRSFGVGVGISRSRSKQVGRRRDGAMEDVVMHVPRRKTFGWEWTRDKNRVRRGRFVDDDESVGRGNNS